MYRGTGRMWKRRVIGKYVSREIWIQRTLRDVPYNSLQVNPRKEEGRGFQAGRCYEWTYR